MENLNEEQIIEELENSGIKVIRKPIALVPDTLEELDGILDKAVGFVQMDIHTALSKLRSRKELINKLMEF